jgi:hypothetical protein
MRFNAQSMPRAVRIFILALAILATLGVSVASASHFDASPNSCSICFAAHTVAFETPSIQLFCGPQMAGRATPASLVSGYQPCFSRTYSSRGPPSSSL